MSNTDISRLVKADNHIQKIVQEYGLDCFPQEFDVIPAQKMLEIMSYNFPVQYSHWSFGRDYEKQRTQYENTGGIPYEVVLNSNPSRAFLMNNNPYPIQVLVMAHVYGHNDFMKNNIHFSHTRRDMLTSASEAAERFRNYEEQYGINAVEKMIDAAHAIQYNIDHDFFIRSDSRDEAQTAAIKQISRRSNSQFADMFGFGEAEKTFDEKRDEKRKIKRKNPVNPQIDIMDFVMKHSTRGFEEWELDIISTVRDQSRYFAPQRKTKVMNEGWASFWHMRIMSRLFQDGYLTAEEHGYYNLYNSRVIASNPYSLNPYLLGIKTFCNIEDRWNKGHFGADFETSEDPNKWQTDLKLGKGIEKIFEVRRTYADWFFLDDFMNKKIVEDSELYLYVTQTKESHQDLVIENTHWDTIKRLVVNSFAHSGFPLIKVEDGDFNNSRDLYLRHYSEGQPLDDEYMKHTLGHIYSLWGRPVHIETIEVKRGKESSVVYTFNDDGLNKKDITKFDY